MTSAARPCVGIVTRTKNRVVLLRRAIASVLNQSYDNWRLYIVNDGGDAEEVEALIDLYRPELGNRFHVAHHQTSLGMEAASNAALRIMHAEMAIIHDDDDTWAPEFLSRMLAVYQIERKILPSIAGVTCYSNRIIENVTGNLVTVVRSEPYNQYLTPGPVPLHNMLEQNMFPPISFLFDLNTCRKVGYFDETIPVLGDWDFNIRFLLERDIWILPETLAFYHHRLTASGDLGNSVIAGIDKHTLYRILLENRWLRKDLQDGRFGAGSFIGLRSQLERIEWKISGG